MTNYLSFHQLSPYSSFPQQKHNFCIHQQREREESMGKVPEEEHGRSSKPAPPPPDLYVKVQGTTFHLNKKCLASKCPRLTEQLSLSNIIGSITHYDFGNIPTDPKTFDLVGRFCHGEDINLSADTVIPLTCLASLLDMNEEHCPGNLLKKTMTFFSTKILPNWNETIKAFRTAEPLVLNHAKRLGLIDACINSIAEKVRADPNLLKNPIENFICGGETSGARRRLFMTDWYAEDLTSLPLNLYALAMSSVSCAGVPEEYVAHCLYRYAKERAGVETETSTPASGPSVVCQQKEVMEAIERLLPEKKGALHVKFLFEMLHSAIALKASTDCTSGLESRIAMQLPEATIEDLLFPSHGYTKETMHDIECIRRILIQFCSNYYCNNTSDNVSELVTVSELVEDFLPEVAKDPNLTKEMFTSLVGMLVAILNAIDRCCDGVYKAIDVYLAAHGHLTESEREEVCRVLDIKKMSMEACEHAAGNERMPMRMVAQVLFVGQLRIREVIADVLTDFDGVAREEEEEKGVVVVGRGVEEEEEEEVRKEIVRMDSRVMKLEEECGKMRDEIKRCRGCGGMRKKRGFWKVVMSKLGCKDGLHECHCFAKKVHPK